MWIREVRRKVWWRREEETKKERKRGIGSKSRSLMSKRKKYSSGLQGDEVSAPGKF